MKKLLVFILKAASIAAVATAIGAALAEVEKDGTIHVRAFDLPLSDLLTEETRTVLKRQIQEASEKKNACSADIASTESDAIVKEVAAYRQCLEEHYYRPIIAKYRARYNVEIQAATIGEIATEVINPAEGIPKANQHRVLINLHGGGFVIGNRWAGQIESIPIAAVSKIKVVSVDYRMAPEHQFPAASEDVAAVYKALLADYRPESIGIYGCSAGGFLTAQVLAWFQREELPMPGAVGMFCAGIDNGKGGDSWPIAAAMTSPRTGSSLFQKVSYFKREDFKSPLASPWLDAQLMARFPDALLITSTRDASMSTVVSTHSRLTKLGVDADLHVWEGLGHAFFYEPDLPESREVYDVASRFFNERLAR